MQRKSISESEYTVILEELVITGMHANVMSVTTGKHKDHGRVVLLRSGTSFVIVADDLVFLAGANETSDVAKAIAHRAECLSDVILFSDGSFAA